MVYFVLAIAVSYGVWVLAMAAFASRITTLPESKSSIQTFITVVVAARNEQNTITALLHTLAHQTYQAYEVIVIDDHSEDETARVAETFVHASAVFKVIKNAGVGKKQALTTGIREAQGEIIVTTDADCTVPRTWLETVNLYFQNDACQLAFGGVKLETENFFHRMQAIEFSSLIGTAAISASLGWPTMCNGANLAFRKKTFSAVSGYEGNEHIPSGDDEFLMRKIQTKYPHGIFYVSGERALVTTRPMDSLKGFIAQRVRWAGKWRHNTSLYTVCLAVYIFMVQALSILCLTWGVWNEVARPWAASYLIIRMAVEYIFLSRVSRHCAVRWDPVAFLALQVLYPFYVVVIGLFSQVVSYRWKGR